MTALTRCMFQGRSTARQTRAMQQETHSQFAWRPSQPLLRAPCALSSCMACSNSDHGGSHCNSRCPWVSYMVMSSTLLQAIMMVSILSPCGNVTCCQLLLAAHCLQVSNALGGSIHGDTVHTYILRCLLAFRLCYMLDCS